MFLREVTGPLQVGSQLGDGEGRISMVAHGVEQRHEQHILFQNEIPHCQLVTIVIVTIEIWFHLPKTFFCSCGDILPSCDSFSRKSANFFKASSASGLPTAKQKFHILSLSRSDHVNCPRI